MRRGALQNGTRGDAEEKNYFSIFCIQKVFSLLHKITVEPLMLHGPFCQCSWYVSGP